MTAKWPKIGDKITYVGVHRFWLTNIVKNAEDNLVPGTRYTITSINVASSWASVKLEGFGDMEFALGFFKIN